MPWFSVLIVLGLPIMFYDLIVKSWNESPVQFIFWALIVALYVWKEIYVEKPGKKAAPKPFELDVDLLSPAEYEEHCADALKKCGWSVSLTKASGDQGADVVAELRGIRAVVQCKRYGKAAGNKAVQEAVAAKAHYRAQLAVVVAPKGFTRAAQALAKSNRALLLHHDDLPFLERVAKIP